MNVWTGNLKTVSQETLLLSEILLEPSPLSVCVPDPWAARTQLLPAPVPLPQVGTAGVQSFAAPQVRAIVSQSSSVPVPVSQVEAGGVWWVPAAVSKARAAVTPSSPTPIFLPWVEVAGAQLAPASALAPRGRAVRTQPIPAPIHALWVGAAVA